MTSRVLLSVPMPIKSCFPDAPPEHSLIETAALSIFPDAVTSLLMLVEVEVSMLTFPPSFSFV